MTRTKASGGPAGGAAQDAQVGSGGVSVAGIQAHRGQSWVSGGLQTLSLGIRTGELLHFSSAQSYRSVR